jgi:hypothetical protein
MNSLSNDPARLSAASAKDNLLLGSQGFVAYKKSYKIVSQSQDALPTRV